MLCYKQLSSVNTGYSRTSCITTTLQIKIFLCRWRYKSGINLSWTAGTFCIHTRPGSSHKCRMHHIFNLKRLTWLAAVRLHLGSCLWILKYSICDAITLAIQNHSFASITSAAFVGEIEECYPKAAINIDKSCNAYVVTFRIELRLVTKFMWGSFLIF